MTSRIKKGGQFRYIKSDLSNDSSFIVPAGFQIDSIEVDNRDSNNPVTVAMGLTESSIETAEFNVTSLNYQANIDVTTFSPTATFTASIPADPIPVEGCTVTVAGVEVSLAQGDDASGVATKIANAVSASANWVATANVGGAGEVVITRDATGTVNLYSITVAPDAHPYIAFTAIAFSPAVNTTVDFGDVTITLIDTDLGATWATPEYDVRAKISSEINLNSLLWSANGAANHLYITPRLYSTDINTFAIANNTTGITFSAPAIQEPTVGDVTAGDITVTLGALDIVSPTTVAAALVDAINDVATGSTLWEAEVDSVDDTQVNLTALAEGATTDFVIALDTATGIFFSAVTTIEAGDSDNGVLASSTIAPSTVVSYAPVASFFSLTADTTVNIEVTSASPEVDAYIQLSKVN